MELFFQTDRRAHVQTVAHGDTLAYGEYAYETIRIFSSRARSRSRTFPKSTRTGPERTLQLEAARQIDDLRLSRRHDRDHAELDHDGDRPRRIRHRTSQG